MVANNNELAIPQAVEKLAVKVGSVANSQLLLLKLANNCCDKRIISGYLAISLSMLT